MAEIVNKQSKTNPVKAGIGYSIANIVIKSIGFLTLPIFSRLLTTDEYGIYSVFMAYSTILSYLVGLTLNVSIKRANVEFPNSIDKYVSTVSLIYKINFVICIVLVLTLGKAISPLLDLSFIQLILLVVCAEGTAYLALYNAKISLKYSYKEYMVWAAINSVGSIGLSILLIFTLCGKDHLLGRLLGSTITLFVTSVILTIKNFVKEKPSFDKRYLKFGVLYSLPVVPNGIAQILLAQFDRVMIKEMTGKSEAGIYSFASNIKLILTVLVDSISVVWSTYFYDVMQKNDLESIRKRAIEILLFFLLLTIGLTSISPEIIKIIGTKDYYDGKYVVIPMVLEGFILMIYSLVVQGEYYSKKTIFVFLGTCFAAIINIVSNYFFIKWYGYKAAAYTTLASYFLYLLLHIFISKRVIGFYIVPLKYIAASLAFLSVFAAINIYFVDVFLIRILSMVIFFIPVLIFLDNRIRKFEGISIIGFTKKMLFKKGDNNNG